VAERCVSDVLRQKAQLPPSDTFTGDYNASDAGACFPPLRPFMMQLAHADEMLGSQFVWFFFLFLFSSLLFSSLP
jgi:hypothetical protein